MKNMADVRKIYPQLINYWRLLADVWVSLGAPVMLSEHCLKKKQFGVARTLSHYLNQYWRGNMAASGHKN